MEELSPADYWAILKRRKKLFFIVTSFVFILSFLFALNWSNYRAEATVEIAQPDIDTATTNPNEVTSIADLRISRIQQKVLSVGSLVDIIRKYNLYPGSQKNKTLAAIARKMHNKIRVTLVGGQLANPASAQKASARQLSAIAFTLSFDYSNPRLAQKVTNELVNRFLEEDSKDRQSQAQQTAAFLSKQIKLLEASLVEQEQKIATFRSENGDISPQALTFNKQAAATTSIQLQHIASQIMTTLGTEGNLRAQLAAMNPYSRTMADGQILTTPAIQLKGLESEYATLIAKYSNQHPDVVKVRRQIASLKPLVNGRKKNTNKRAPLIAKINDARTKLEASKATNNEDHPDIKNLKAQLQKYQEELKSLTQKENQDLIIKDADNPAYLQIATQLRTVQQQYNSLIAQKEALQKEQEKYGKAVANSPIAEQKYSILSRDYDNTLARYRELKEKKLQADMSEEIAKDRTGDRLVLTNPPEVPTKTQPGRIIFVLGGFITAFFTGLVSVFIAQFLSNSVIGPRQLAALSGDEPLVCVPHISTKFEKKKKAKWYDLLQILLAKLGIRSV